SDCPLYEMGELRGYKKHGDTWLNDNSPCESCECIHGEKRCLYHYCNDGLTEGLMPRPSGRTPLADDEDFNDLQEGSGRLPDDYYKILHDLEGAGSRDDERKNERDNWENETHHPISADFCTSPCRKSCPHGYKVDEVRGCRTCKCHKCPSIRQCHLQCPGGLVQDHRGCRTCRCQSPKLAVFTASHDEDFVVEDGMGASGDVYVTSQTEPPCNTTHLATDGRSSHNEEPSISWEPLDHLPATHYHSDTTPDDLTYRRASSEGASDGTTKSAVQTLPVEWTQLCLIIIPLVLVFLLVAALILHYWRRYHRDKYDINAYRPAETEKLRPVKTADDQCHVREV
ncbi:hypothetical protein OTU49_007747, partial [Cherax quadricarinatus]